MSWCPEAWPPTPQSLQLQAWCHWPAQPSSSECGQELMGGIRGSWAVDRAYELTRWAVPTPLLLPELWPALFFAQRCTEPRSFVKMPSLSKSSFFSLSVSPPLPSMWHSPKAGEDPPPSEAVASQGNGPVERAAASLSLQICLYQGLAVDLEAGPWFPWTSVLSVTCQYFIG